MSWNECLINGQVPTLACVEVLVGKVISLFSLLVLVGLFAMIVYGAYNYITAFGSEEKVKKAQDTLKFAFVGLIVYLSAFLIIYIIGNLFLKNPESLWKLNLINSGN